MKAKIHPIIFKDVKVVCSCGNTFTTTSTVQSIKVETCSKCHPFYTGEHRFLDVQGRVEAFKKKQVFAKANKDKLTARKNKRENKEEVKTKSLREILSEA